MQRKSKKCYEFSEWRLAIRGTSRKAFIAVIAASTKLFKQQLEDKSTLTQLQNCLWKNAKAPEDLLSSKLWKIKVNCIRNVNFKKMEFNMYLKWIKWQKDHTAPFRIKRNIDIVAYTSSHASRYGSKQRLYKAKETTLRENIIQYHRNKGNTQYCKSIV